MNWIQLAQNRDHWRDVLKTVMNLRIPKNDGNFLTTWRAVSFLKTTALDTFCLLQYIIEMEFYRVADEQSVGLRGGYRLGHKLDGRGSTPHAVRHFILPTAFK